MDPALRMASFGSTIATPVRPRNDRADGFPRDERRGATRREERSAPTADARSSPPPARPLAACGASRRPAVAEPHARRRAGGAVAIGSCSPSGARPAHRREALKRQRRRRGVTFVELGSALRKSRRLVRACGQARHGHSRARPDIILESSHTGRMFSLGSLVRFSIRVISSAAQDATRTASLMVGSGCAASTCMVAERALARDRAARRGSAGASRAPGQGLAAERVVGQVLAVLAHRTDRPSVRNPSRARWQLAAATIGGAREARHDRHRPADLRDDRHGHRARDGRRHAGSAVVLVFGAVLALLSIQRPPYRRRLQRGWARLSWRDARRGARICIGPGRWRSVCAFRAARPRGPIGAQRGARLVGAAVRAALYAMDSGTTPSRSRPIPTGRRCHQADVDRWGRALGRVACAAGRRAWRDGGPGRDRNRPDNRARLQREVHGRIVPAGAGGCAVDAARGRRAPTGRARNRPRMRRDHLQRSAAAGRPSPQA